MKNKLICPICQSDLKFFRQLHLSHVDYVFECSEKPGHYRWPKNCGFDSLEELDNAARKVIKP